LLLPLLLPLPLPLPLFVFAVILSEAKDPDALLLPQRFDPFHPTNFAAVVENPGISPLPLPVFFHPLQNCHPERSGSRYFVSHAVEGPAVALALACSLPPTSKNRHFNRSRSPLCEPRSGETALATAIASSQRNEVLLSSPGYVFPSAPHPGHLQSTSQPITPLPSPPRQIVALLTLAILTSLFPVSRYLNAQQPTPRTVILLDPAHGGPETGAHLSDHLLEKDFTLAFAARLRTLLTAAGFTVISTRDADPTVPFATDQRAEIANHAHPAACLILHATASGSGVHLVTSALTPPDDDSPTSIIPWDTAQAASIPQSLNLANELGLSLLHAKLPVLLSRASLRPLDNLTCPAVAIEIAPLATADSSPTPVTDDAWQQHVAQAIASGLTSWRTHNAPAGAAR